MKVTFPQQLFDWELRVAASKHVTLRSLQAPLSLTLLTNSIHAQSHPLHVELSDLGVRLEVDLPRLAEHPAASHVRAPVLAQEVQDGGEHLEEYRCKMLNQFANLYSLDPPPARTPSAVPTHLAIGHDDQALQSQRLHSREVYRASLLR